MITVHARQINQKSTAFFLNREQKKPAVMVGGADHKELLSKCMTDVFLLKREITSIVTFHQHKEVAGQERLIFPMRGRWVFNNSAKVLLQYVK